MPQLQPYFFVNQASFTLISISLIVYLIGTYLLPYTLSLYISRTYVTSL